LKPLEIDSFIVLKVLEVKVIELTDEGKDYAENGAPEFLYVSKMQVGKKVSEKDMEDLVGKKIAGIGKGKAFKQKWIKKDGDQLVRIAENIVDEDKP